MEHDYWHQRWDENRIGFHLPEVNAHLRAYWPKLGLHQNKKVFVPLCGKSNDMIYLRDMGFQVVGIELNRDAIEAFFQENKIQATKIDLPETDLSLWKSDSIEIYNGDFFKLSQTMLSDCEAVYDRAALVALPPKMRQAYVRHLRAILPARIKILLLSLEYDESKKQGPPFSVTQKMINDYFQAYYTVSLLATHGTPDSQKSDSSQGLLIVDKVYLIES